MPKYIQHKDNILAHFKCLHSGNCCKYPGFVYVNDNNITEMAKQLNMSKQTFRQQYVKKQNGWDIISSPTHQPNCFLNSNCKCSVYNARPKACQSYPNWATIWESDDTFLKETTLCPGLKKAFTTFLAKKK